MIVGNVVTGADAFAQSHAWLEAKVDDRWVLMDPTFASGVIQGTTFIPEYDPSYFDPPSGKFATAHYQMDDQY